MAGYCRGLPFSAGGGVGDGRAEIVTLVEEKLGLLVKELLWVRKE